MPFTVCDHPYGRSTEEAALLDIPTHLCQDLVLRAAASATVSAPWPPVTNPKDAPDGRVRSSRSQPPAMSSTTAAAGDVTALKAG